MYHTWVDFSIYTPGEVKIPEFLQRKFGISTPKTIDIKEAFPTTYLGGKMRYHDWRNNTYVLGDEMFGTDVHIASSLKPHLLMFGYDEENAGVASDELKPLLLPGIGAYANERLYEVLENNDQDMILFKPHDVALLFATQGKPHHITVIEKYQTGPLEEVFDVKQYLPEMGELGNLLARQYNGVMFNGQEWGDSTPESIDRLVEEMQNQLQRQHSFTPREYKMRLV